MREEIQVSHGKLEWPAGTPRTRIDMRETSNQWKKNARDYEVALLKEFDRMGVVAVKITTNNTMQDPGVAIWVSRQTQADYSWQDLLGIDNPSPTRDEIGIAYREKVKPYHADKPGADLETFLLITKARDRAYEWIEMSEGRMHNYAIACDRFKEVRWNLCAIRLTVAALRTVERCGTSALMEKAFSGFAVLTENSSVHTPAA
jgi:hypothetical protein